MRKKPEWTKKVFQEDILAKWKEEVAAEGFSFFWERLKSELQHLASLSSPEAEPSSVDGVWVIDTAISKDLHDLFISQVRDQLEMKEKDWHPSSGETVVDLVHPSLFCYVDGRTPLIPDEEMSSSQISSKEEWEKFLQAAAVPSTPSIPLADSLLIIKQAKSYPDGLDLKQKNEEEVREKKVEEQEEEEEEEEEIELKLDVKLLYHEYQLLNSEEDLPIVNPDNIRKDKLCAHLADIFRWLPAEVKIGRAHV